MGYIEVKSMHIASVATSYALFVLRGIWMIRGSALLESRWARIVPHVIDTVLLATAIALAIITYQYPLTNSWVTAKVIGLIVYIGLGMIALKHGKTPGVRVAAWIAAQVAFAYIVVVALLRHPFPF